MSKDRVRRRDFLKTAAAGTAGAAASVTGITAAVAQTTPVAAPSAATAPAPGYSFLNLDEASFVEALADHMIPADQYTPKGTDIGINVYIDRAMSSGWGA